MVMVLISPFFCRVVEGPTITPTPTSTSTPTPALIPVFVFVFLALILFRARITIFSGNLRILPGTYLLRSSRDNRHYHLALLPSRDRYLPRDRDFCFCWKF